MNFDLIRAFNDAINSHNNIVFFGGAGVSTESGLPDFRGINGIDCGEVDEDGFYAEERRERKFLFNHPDLFYSDFLNDLKYTEAEPNSCHKKLAELERAGRLDLIITQNIDGLHQKAGSEKVLELHGNLREAYCDSCKRIYPVKAYIDGLKCECGGMIRPNVVLFGEDVEQAALDRAAIAISNADMLIVAGTSLTVYPAARLIDYFVGDCLVLIDKLKTVRDGGADILIRDPIAEVFGQIIVD